MEADEAVRQAQAHLQNSEELAQRSIGKEELLYMWDNQITAIDDFLADTEAIRDAPFLAWRGKLRDVKQRLQDQVIQFEAAQEGIELDGDEPSDEERVDMYIEMAGEMVAVVKEALDEAVTRIEDLPKWEAPLSVVNGYLADSEPYQEMSRDLQKVRSVVRVARRDLKNQIQSIFEQWRQEDLASA